MTILGHLHLQTSLIKLHKENIIYDPELALAQKEGIPGGEKHGVHTQTIYVTEMCQYVFISPYKYGTAMPVQDYKNGINSIQYLKFFCTSRIILIIFNFLKNIIPFIICSFFSCFSFKLKIKQRFDAQIFPSRRLFLLFIIFSILN